MTALAEILGLGTTEILLILLIVIVFFGAAKIPQLARSLGRAKGEFERGSVEGRELSKGGAAANAEDEKILNAARELGIPTEGRSLAEVRRDVKAKLG